MDSRSSLTSGRAAASRAGGFAEEEQGAGDAHAQSAAARARRGSSMPGPPANGNQPPGQLGPAPPRPAPRLCPGMKGRFPGRSRCLAAAGAQSRMRLGGHLLLSAAVATHTAPPAPVYLVATPIGNLGDITLRAVDTLRNADCIAAEDTRHTKKLLHHLQIQNKKQIQHHEHNLDRAIPKIIQLAKQGMSVAVVSDAGTPGISDPGAKLASECAARGVPLVPVPGACAAITALSVSGFSCTDFRFAGFLPRVGKGRRLKLAELTAEPHAVVFYESPQRILSTLQDISAAGSGQRNCVCARELTKLHEEIERGSVSELASSLARRADRGEEICGEFTVILGPLSADELKQRNEEELGDKQLAARQLLVEMLHEGESVSRAARSVATQLGTSRSLVYPLALEVQEQLGRGTRESPNKGDDAPNKDEDASF